MGSGVARGQNLENPIINDFEISPAGSLEWDMLNRMYLTGQYYPADLPRLSRLTVLESIAMYQNMRSDLRMTMIGARLEGEMSALWDTAVQFNVAAGSFPWNVGDAARSRAMLDDVYVAYRDLTSSLGVVPAFSPRAAYRLQEVGRLLPVMNDVLGTVEANLAAATAVPVQPTLDLDAIRDQSHLLVEELRGLIRSVNEAKPVPADRDAFIGDLNSLLELVQGFDRMVAAEPTDRDLLESLRLVRSGLWPVEARMARLTGAPELAGRWREFRRRISALSDVFGLPRVISLAQPARPAKAVDQKLLAAVDRALAAMDKFLADRAPGLGDSDQGLRFLGDTSQLRRMLLQFRQHVAANDAVALLSTLLRGIELANRQLTNRSSRADRIDRAGVRLDTHGFEEPAQALEKLRILLPKQ
jgi:hypothetical protein